MGGSRRGVVEGMIGMAWSMHAGGRGWEGRGARGDRRGGQDLIRKFLGLLLGGGSGATLTAKGVLVRGIFKKSSTKLEVYGDKFPHIYQGILNMGTKLQASILNI